MVGFASVEDAGECVARIIGAGIIPGGMEMMDKPAIHAAEDSCNAGYPLRCRALLIIELDAQRRSRRTSFSRGSHRQGMWSDHAANLDVGEEALAVLGWRKGGVFQPLDGFRRTIFAWTGTIPRGKLSEFDGASGNFRKIRTGVANVFHGGDGNSSVDICTMQTSRAKWTKQEASGGHPAHLR